MLTDMKRSKAEAKEASVGPVSPDQEEYPYGLRLHLNDDELEKLGIDKLPKVGEGGSIEAVFKIVSTHESANEGQKKYRSVELQITHMDLGAEDKSTTDDEKVERLYSKPTK